MFSRTVLERLHLAEGSGSTHAFAERSIFKEILCDDHPIYAFIEGKDLKSE